MEDKTTITLDVSGITNFDLNEYLTVAEQKGLEQDNLYVKNLLSISNLHILHEGRVRKSYSSEGVVGLFHLFLLSNIFPL